MLTTQVTLTDQQTQALRSIAQRTGKTEQEVIVEAVEQFIAQQTSAEDRQAAQQQAIEEPAADSFTDLLAAASTSLEFWDNALADEDWNNA